MSFEVLKIFSMVEKDSALFLALGFYISLDMIEVLGEFDLVSLGVLLGEMLK